MGDLLNNPHLQNPEEGDQEEEEETEESLSLCDLPLNPKNKSKDLSNHTPRSRAEAPEFFEFFSDLSSEMCPADDIIFCGKLIPFKDLQSPPTHQTPKTSNTGEKPTKQTPFRRRSESLSKLQSPVTRSDSGTSTRLMRNSRSLDYTKLHRSSNSMVSPAQEIERNSSVKSLGKSDMALRRAAKPRWYLLMFGLVKFPPEMELSDIKNRQVRRNHPSTLFPPPLSADGKFPVNRSSSKGSWRLLRALSCKDHASVAVTASFCLPHV
ncbi:uncharacterized protein LOC133870985 [Alnus glutinosa]|uniref:uncharacterized protein LOC133870985 n=1 Tax=Alnus glutinosa TaxID=3517 RepID=UPI002D76CD48|nr:uncharacterized protein LOC133870985 [Alnus glutinosa]